jgi:hypothetical protein
VATFFATLTTVQVGIYGVDPDAAKMANKDYRVKGATSYTWNFRLKTGTAWNATNACVVGWWIPAAGEAIPAASQWTITAYRNGVLQSKYVDDLQYGQSKIKQIGTYTLATDSIENWTVVAKVVPEPGSMVAMFSGLVGLVGFGIRRKK